MADVKLRVMVRCCGLVLVACAILACGGPASASGVPDHYCNPQTAGHCLNGQQGPCVGPTQHVVGQYWDDYLKMWVPILHSDYTQQYGWITVTTYVCSPAENLTCPTYHVECISTARYCNATDCNGSYTFDPDPGTKSTCNP